MSVLVVGMSHKSAPVQLLEQVALDSDGVQKLIANVQDLEHVSEATVLATCNRIEVYAEVDRFHGSVEAISGLLCDPVHGDATELVNHLYVHYDDGAVAHLFNVASGLDSMVLGEGQILGQAREALRAGQEAGTIGPALNLLFQQALRVGKRSHAETDIDRAGPSVVSAGLDSAARQIGDVSGRRVLVVGAGSMASLAVRTATSNGAEVLIANRTAEKAARVAALHGATSVSMDEVVSLIPTVDVLVSCTGATGLVLTRADVAAGRVGSDRPLAIVDLALPHDVDPAVAELPGIQLTTLATLAEELRDHEAMHTVQGVRDIVGQELTAFLAARRSAIVTPTLIALRTMATSVVETEAARLGSRLPDLSDAERAEIQNAMRRVAEKLLHQPTVRIKELANETAEVSYAAALAKLFALDQDAVDAVTRGGVS